MRRLRGPALAMLLPLLLVPSAQPAEPVQDGFEVACGGTVRTMSHAAQSCTLQLTIPAGVQRLQLLPLEVRMSIPPPHHEAVEDGWEEDPLVVHPRELAAALRAYSMVFPEYHALIAGTTILCWGEVIAPHVAHRNHCVSRYQEDGPAAGTKQFRVDVYVPECWTKNVESLEPECPWRFRGLVELRYV